MRIEWAWSSIGREMKAPPKPGRTTLKNCNKKVKVGRPLSPQQIIRFYQKLFAVWVRTVLGTSRRSSRPYIFNFYLPKSGSMRLSTCGTAVSKSGLVFLSLDRQHRTRARFLSLKRTSTAKINWTAIHVFCIFNAARLQLAYSSAALAPHS
jgi:hypothetical protein